MDRLKNLLSPEMIDLLDVCLVVLLTVHLLAVNVATAAPLVCMWLKHREVRHADAAAGRLGLFLAWQSLLGLAVGIVFGVLTLGLLWLDADSSFFAALAAVPRRRLWFGIAELVFFFAFMGLYVWGWQRLARRPWLQHGIALLAATDLIYHFPPLFAAIAVVQSRPELWGQEVSYSQFMSLLGESETLARIAHFLLASLAVTGTIMLAYALRMARDEAESRRLSVWGARLALVPTLLQLLAGAGLLWAMPEASRGRLLGGDWLASSLFAASLLAMFPLMHHLAAVSLGNAGRDEVRRSLVWMMLVVLLMVGARHYGRHQPSTRVGYSQEQPMSLEVIDLHDDVSGSRAKVLAGFGFNCYSFLPAPAGRPIEVLWSVPNFESGKERPSRSGIPILFPFPGRIGGASLKFQGKRYALEPSDPFGNAIHGFVMNRPWKVIEQTQRRVVGRFQGSQVDPALAARWPADFSLTVAYELRGNALCGEFTAHNPDNKPLPIGLGTHPYFRVPLSPEGRRDDCVVTVPAGEFWELKDMLATGRRLPVGPDKDLRRGMRYGETKLDDVLTGLSFSNGQCIATIDDAAAGLRLSIKFGDEFRECVVFNPPHREAICIEPYTCVPDAARLQAASVDSGLRILGPGEAFRATIDIGLETTEA